MAKGTSKRVATVSRKTAETDISIALAVDGTGVSNVGTGVGFFDHMLTLFAKHGLFDLTVKAKGDVEVDYHHTVEDVGLVLGQAFRKALGDKVGIRRFASALLPLDEALIQVAVDISGRPYLAYGLEFAPDTPGLGAPPFDPQLAEEFWRAFVTAASLKLHIHRFAGKNTHHMLEASFKGVARCLRDAVRIEGGDIPSTKGSL